MPPTQRLSFRLARHTDLAQLTHLINAAYRPAQAGSGWTSEHHWVAGNRLSMAQLQQVYTTSCLMVAEATTAIATGPASRGDDSAADDASLILGVVSIARKPQHAYLSLLAVGPNHQNTGLGKALIAQAEQHALTHWGLTTIQIDVIRQRTELVAFYQRRGYQAVGAARDYPPDPRLGQPLTADLQVQTFQKVLGQSSAKPATSSQ